MCVMDNHILNLQDMGLAIRRERKLLKLTQNQLAIKANMRRQTIISIEKGEDANITSLFKILMALNFCMELKPIRPDYTKLGDLLNES